MLTLSFASDRSSFGTSIRVRLSAVRVDLDEVSPSVVSISTSMLLLSSRFQPRCSLSVSCAKRRVEVTQRWIQLLARCYFVT